MIFLGSLDDKTIEYPYGEKTNIRSTPLDDILHHTLFGKEPIVLEEGFILAAEEAVNPSSVSPVLIPAIKSGLIRVATRYGDMHEYAQERRIKKHAAPPNNLDGNQYLTDLQNACKASGAFLDYPPDVIDEITFSRFVDMANSEYTLKLLHSCEVDLPKDFNSLYEHEYNFGNDGKKWTARSAWESLIKKLYIGNDAAVHSLMASANLERQILRAAAISKVNNEHMRVETGAITSPHELLLQVKRDEPLHSENYTIYPRVGIDLLSKNLDVLFDALGDDDSPLHKYRNLYVELLENRSNNSIAALERAASNYETEIYSLFNCKPIEKNTPINVVGTAGVGAVTGGVVSALWHSLRSNPKKPMFSDQLKKDYTRRQFFKGSMFGALLTTMYVIENKTGVAIESGVRYVRTSWQEDLADNYLLHLNKVKKSHQILDINKDALDSLKF